MRRILVSAMGCAPNMGSEQGVGWNWILQIAKNNEVHVISVTRRKDEIENEIPVELRDNITFHYFDVSKTTIKRLPPSTILFYLQYTLWQIGIIPLIYKLNKRHHFDFAIHLTFGSIWMPTFLPFFRIPFIWGPLGGAEFVPISFLKSMGSNFYDSTMQRFRYFLMKTVPFNPFISFAFSRSSAILTRTKDTAGIIPQKYKHKVREVLETAMENFTCNKNIRKDNDTHIKLLSTGRLVPFKNHITAITSLSLLKDKYDFRYTIIGTGSDKMRLVSAVKSLGLLNYVEFIDTLPRNEVIERLNNYDIYLFPSLREGGSWALMEAMCVGLPVICLNSSGMSIITDDKSAIQLDITDPDRMSKDMADAIEYLINNPSKRKEMGEMARKRILENFNWNTKGVFMENLFNELSKK